MSACGPLAKIVIGFWKPSWHRRTTVRCIPAVSQLLRYSVQANCTMLGGSRRTNLHQQLPSFRLVVGQDFVQKAWYPSIVGAGQVQHLPVFNPDDIGLVQQSHRSARNIVVLAAQPREPGIHSAHPLIGGQKLVRVGEFYGMMIAVPHKPATHEIDNSPNIRLGNRAFETKMARSQSAIASL